RPGIAVVERSAHDGGVAVVRQPDRDASEGASNRTGADQLVSLLGPYAGAAGKHPHSPGITVVGRPAHHGGIAVSGQRDGTALLGLSESTGADQLVSLLGPYAGAAGEDPHRPDVAVVSRSAHHGGVAISGQRDRDALLGSNPVSAE